MGPKRTTKEQEKEQGIIEIQTKKAPKRESNPRWLGIHLFLPQQREHRGTPALNHCTAHPSSDLQAGQTRRFKRGTEGRAEG